MKYRILFRIGIKQGLFKEIKVLDDNDAERQFNEFKGQVASNPEYLVHGLVRVDLVEKITRILPRSENPVWSVKH